MNANDKEEEEEEDKDLPRWKKCPDKMHKYVIVGGVKCHKIHYDVSR